MLVVATVFVIGLAGAGVSRAGFAWVQPESFLAEEIAKDPTSPIAVAHEMARKNGTTPGAFNPIFVGLALLAALVMVAVDARGRPVLASVAYSHHRLRHGERHPGPHAGVRAVATVCP